MNRRLWSAIAGLVGLLVLTTLEAQEVKNLAALADGGRLVFFSSQYNNTDWKAVHLLDGAGDKGWAGQNSGAQSVVIAFRNNALAEIHDVIINPYTKEDSATWAKDIEILVSTTYPFRDFRSVGSRASGPRRSSAGWSTRVESARSGSSPSATD